MLASVESFTAHINSVDKNIKSTSEDTKDKCLPFLDCAVCIEENGNLNLFDSHHLLEHKIGVIRTLQNRAENVPYEPERKKREHTHVPLKHEVIPIGLLASFQMPFVIVEKRLLKRRATRPKQRF